MRIGLTLAVYGTVGPLHTAMGRGSKEALPALAVTQMRDGLCATRSVGVLALGRFALHAL